MAGRQRPANNKINVHEFPIDDYPFFLQYGLHLTHFIMPVEVFIVFVCTSMIHPICQIWNRIFRATYG
ncbi:hypothetical protein EUGRSUZ_H00744 [Eucalyptus grandis]|uniref:Transmembrane protein n=2 Tax=Eucalyptus grandis TaxID=71139 RepID=A0A059AVY6_EUCGR|nr:hypothetical protein EUGRSUZ_H00744 [Eucalyptus grandis]